MVPPPTTTSIEVPLLEIMDETGVPPIRTFAAVAPVKLVPVIVIVVPGQPEVGDIDVIVGGGGGVKVYVKPAAGLTALLNSIVEVFAVPAVVDAQFEVVVRLLKSALLAPFKPI